MDFFVIFLVAFKVTKVTNKCYHGYYWTPKIAKNWPKQHKKLFFCPKGKKSLGRSPPQELEVGPRSGLYLLVFIKIIKGIISLLKLFWSCCQMFVLYLFSQLYQLKNYNGNNSTFHFKLLYTEYQKSPCY